MGGQDRIQSNAMVVKDRIGVPVPAALLDELLELSDFRRAYEVDGMAPSEFADFGAARTTLRQQFLDAEAQLDALVRDVIVPAT
ncbi:hypothetical protein GCM10023087_07190 [Microbacterium rhizosphaerae]